MRFVRLNIINNAFEHDNITTISGDNLFALVQSVYPKGLPLNTSLYHGAWDSECDITPKSVQDIDTINTLDGEFWLVTYPADPMTLTIVAISVAVSVAVAFLMPKPEIPNTSSSQPPSPNNALASRGNRQRLGGRVPDIFGEIWAFPDLIAPTYSVYIDHKEVEYAYMALGVGEYDVKKAYDDTTPIGFINGATASVFNPNKSFLDAPDVRFGSHLSSDETAYNALFVKRYGAVNGQVLPPPNNYVILNDGVAFQPPNRISIVNRDLSQFKAGGTLMIEGASALPSINIRQPYSDTGRNLLRLSDRPKTGNYLTGQYELTKAPSAGQKVTITLWGALDEYHTSWRAFNSNGSEASALGDLAQIADGVYQATLTWVDNNINTHLNIYQMPNGNGNLSRIDRIKLEIGEVGTGYSQAPEETGLPPMLTYNLSGSYTIESVSADGITLSQPERVASDWQTLINNNDTADGSGVVLSNEENPIWQGWFYTDLAEHDRVLINLKAPNGLYVSYGAEWTVQAIDMLIESELVDENARPIDGTMHINVVTLKSQKFEQYARHVTPSGTRIEQGLFKYVITRVGSLIRTNDDDVRRTAAATHAINNPHFGRGKRMRWRIRRLTSDLKPVNGSSPVHEVRIADCLGARYMTADDTPPNVTLVSTKTLATEGAMSLKERKLKLLVQRRLRDYRNDDSLILSNRIDDIIYNIATDPLLGGVTAKDVNMTQISAEIDSQISYFGTDKCSEFCGTFDNTDVTCEEMIQTVAQAGFCQAYRLNNQIHLHFERKQDYAVVQFNSHNILPDSYSYSESFGARNNHDGVQVTYTDPNDDAKITLDYPSDKSAQKPQKLDLLGVRNKIQAHMHLMRTHHKNQLAYKSCEFTGADESGIVIPTNRIDVASQFNTDIVQGVIERLDTVGGQIVATVSEPVSMPSGTLFVQTTAGTVDNIKVTLGDNSYQLILARMPSQPLSLGRDSVVQATFKLVSHSELDRDAYIVSSKDRGENPLSHKLTCVNYTDKYYQNDDDFKKGLISL